MGLMKRFETGTKVVEYTIRNQEVRPKEQPKHGKKWKNRQNGLSKKVKEKDKREAARLRSLFFKSSNSSEDRKRIYKQYLKTAIWQRRRTYVLIRDRHTCQNCGSRNSLEVHHYSYEQIFRESANFLITLCEICHEVIHEMQILGNFSLKEATLELFRRSERFDIVKKLDR